MEQKNRILIVEDDTDINNLLYTALQKAGYETVQAFSGTEARMLFQMDKAGFSLILLDLMLPGIDGYQSAGNCRAKSQGTDPSCSLQKEKYLTKYWDWSWGQMTIS